MNTPPTGAQIDSAKNSPGGEGVLQTFFNSLLSRKSGGSPGMGSPRTPNTMADNLTAANVHAELDRMGSPRTPNTMADNLTAANVHAELDRMIGSNRIASNSSTPTHNLNVSTSSEQ
ncbi:unnamed protein product [Oppiella nova]|uniref:Uncharacterized protein n=1 Tax=Oppiella nova TaxID=334625 RepID=A0A7R9MMJ1_9ACAR|nr:unnamed protein product [Oppiella nova]CAG2180217.1 unnamed protein product [Oppiella nova]